MRGLRGLIRYAIWIVFKPTSWHTWWTSILVCIAGLGLLALSSIFYIAGVSIYGSGTAAGVAAVLLFIVGVMVSIVALVIAFSGFFRIFQVGGLAVLIGVPLIPIGIAVGQAFPFGAGVSSPSPASP